MVKNTCGGSKHKGQARKTVNFGKSSIKLRIALDEGEIYAQVNKIFGGPLCSVLGIDNITRNGVIRGKFRNKGKDIIKPGSWVLVGLRDWASEKPNVVSTCDLLEIYLDSDKERLKKQQPNIDWKIFITNEGGIVNGNKNNQDEMFEFSDTTNEEYENIMKNEISSTNANNTKTLAIAFNDDIDLDDI